MKFSQKTGIIIYLTSQPRLESWPFAALISGLTDRAKGGGKVSKRPTNTTSIESASISVLEATTITFYFTTQNPLWVKIPQMYPPFEQEIVH